MNFSCVAYWATSFAEVLVFTLSSSSAVQPEHHQGQLAYIANELYLVYLLHQQAGNSRACDREWSTRLTTSANTDYVEEGSHMSTDGPVSRYCV